MSRDMRKHLLVARADMEGPDQTVHLPSPLITGVAIRSHSSLDTGESEEVRQRFQ